VSFEGPTDPPTQTRCVTLERVEELQAKEQRLAMIEEYLGPNLLSHFERWLEKRERARAL
jgi:hypothetical protein